MEAETLPRKKTTISRGKVKKSIKNVLCRPDPMFWPLITEEHGKRLVAAVNQYKVSRTEYKKPHWKELKSIPKEQRPKQPVIKKIDGLLLGISECSTAIQNQQCSAVVIESAVNPRSIVQPILEGCVAANIPILCLDNLRQLSFDTFGITTSCLGIRSDNLLDLTNVIFEISRCYKPQVSHNSIKAEEMEVDEEEKTKLSKINESIQIMNSESEFLYLYRTSKKNRVFIPVESTVANIAKQFTGQDFIEFTDKEVKQADSQTYKTMIVKRISNNPNRIKRK